MIKRIVLGISGGVDSAVAGLILKKKGYDVVGVFMRNWDIVDEKSVCSIDQEAEDAEWVCKKLDIPFQEENFVKEYWNDVFSYMVDEYISGNTPNPDVLCNRHIKFDRFVNVARQKYDADAIATGHYARTTLGENLHAYDEDKGISLLRAIDQRKDQTFFLCGIKQSGLRHTIFPIGDLKKKVVYDIARGAQLERIVRKKESFGICFIGKRDFSDFISEYIPDKCGPFIDFKSGEKLGNHRGFHHYTLGQRIGLGGGFSDKMYIGYKNAENNAIYCVSGHHNPDLETLSFEAEPPHFINKSMDQLSLEGRLDCQFKFQHAHDIAKCTFIPDAESNGKGVFHLEEPLRAITPGQFAVLYQGEEECIGCSKIISSHDGLTKEFERRKILNAEL